VLIPIVLGLIVLSIAEIWVIVQVDQLIGALPTIALLFATAVLGGWLLRREGARAWRAFRTAVTEGRPPAAEAVDGVLVVIGGLLMMLPGFVSDVAGLFLVLPPTRRLVRGLVLIQLASRLPAGVIGPLHVRSRRRAATAPAAPPPTAPHPRTGRAVLEGEVVQRDDER
jgi:UPF0716 protein FxsA